MNAFEREKKLNNLICKKITSVVNYSLDDYSGQIFGSKNTLNVFEILLFAFISSPKNQYILRIFNRKKWKRVEWYIYKTSIIF